MIGTADLRSEHGGVRRMLDIMDAIAASARLGEAPPADDVAQIVEFLRVFVDRCHHTKEEQLLFPAIRSAGSSEYDVIVMLLADHERGREAVAAIDHTSRRLSDGDITAVDALRSAIPAYTHLLRDHIVREERDCFDAADRELTESVQQQLADGYDRVEDEVVGGGVHEAFHALLDRLSLVYLP